MDKFYWYHMDSLGLVYLLYPRQTYVFFMLQMHYHMFYNFSVTITFQHYLYKR